MLQNLAATELSEHLESEAPPLVLDVREGFELELAPFPGAVHIPLGELTRRTGELDPERTIVCLCHHGVRSARAAAFLASLGFERLYNLRGGIDAWSAEVDPKVPRY